MDLYFVFDLLRRLEPGDKYILYMSPLTLHELRMAANSPLFLPDTKPTLFGVDIEVNENIVDGQGLLINISRMAREAGFESKTDKP